METPGNNSHIFPFVYSGETAALVSDSGESETGGYDGRYYDRSTRTTWNKCVQLKESMSDITTQEEFAKFDFQVCTYQNQLNIAIVIAISFNFLHLST